MAAQAMMEKVRSESAKAVGQQHLDRTKMESENAFKHRQLEAKTQVDLQKLDIQSQQAGVDHHVALAQLASQLMKNQQDSEAHDQQSQQAEQQTQLQAASALAQHQQNMAKIASDHAQGMTSLASAHHQAMTGHALTGVKTISSEQQADADRLHEEEQARLDRQHQARTTDATLKNQQTLAKMKPKGKT
jgi:hypothetical protein